MDGDSIKKFLFYNAAIDYVDNDLDRHHSFPSAHGDDSSSFHRVSLSSASAPIAAFHRAEMRRKWQSNRETDARHCQEHPFAGILFFTLVTSRSRPVSSLFLLVGVASALISTAIIRKILDDTRRVIAVDDVQLTFEKWDGVGWLLRNTDVNLLGMASSIVALQGECGMLVAKLLRTSTATTPYAVPSQGAAPASIDVFAVQGCANVLLAHFVSIFFLTFALRLLQGLQAKKAAAVIDGLV